MKPAYLEKAEKLMADIKALHATIDEVVGDRIYEAAAEISSAPVNTLKDILVRQCSGGYCRCRAIRKITAKDDGL